MQNEAREWTGGAFVHAHARIEDEFASQADEINESGLATFMENYKDGSMTLSALTIFLEKIFDEKIPITDTQHPTYILDSDYDNLLPHEKLKFFNPKAIQGTLDLMTRCIIERKNIIRRSSRLKHVFSGVEVDLLDSKGLLSVHDEALAELDYVTCSFHSGLWKATGSPDIEKKSQILDAYMYAVDNENVDTLSHPTVNIPPEVREDMSAGEWSDLLKQMREKGVAFEVNLDSTNLIYNDGRNLDRALVISALDAEVPIVIGFDFHYPHDWGAYTSPRLVNVENIGALLQEYLRDGTLDRLLARVIGNIYALKTMGLKPENIVNHSKESFNMWLAPRKQTQI